ncbi:unnamed protein product [Dimorphilus gyrociliatus]|nr:unnamed protein product [Dimorphilus gyrociliatus]
MNSGQTNDLGKTFMYDMPVPAINGAIENGIHHGAYHRTDIEYPVAYPIEVFNTDRMNNYFPDVNPTNVWSNSYFSEEMYRTSKIKQVTVEDPMAPLSPIVRQRGRPRGSSGSLLDEEGKAICLSGDKNEQRRQRNRLAAIQSRTRRKLYIQKLEERQHEQSFIISRLQNEIQYLRLMAGIPLDIPIQNIMDFTNLIQPTNTPSNSPVLDEKEHTSSTEITQTAEKLENPIAN